MASVVSRPSVDADASAYAFHNPATSTLAPVAASNSVVIHIPIASVPALPPLVPQLSVSAMPASAAPIQLPNAISVAPRAGAAATNFAASNPSPTNASPDSPAGGGPDSPKESSAFILSAAAYTAELERQKAILPALPTIEIAFRDVTVSTTVPIVDSGFETIGSKLINLITAAKLRNKNKTKTFDLLHGASGIIRPGTLTLVLAPPGHGKSTLLKTLAGRGLPLKSGSIRYNGLTRDEGLAGGVYTNKLVQYVDQVDAHNPLLSVKETFQFAVDNYSVDPSQMADVISNSQFGAARRTAISKLHISKADKMIQLLGLSEAAATMLGNSMVRGVSGGQRRRVSLGEVLLSEARVLCLDEVTNGLDSSTAFEIINALKIWAKVTGGSVVAALQQPTPEVFQAFDQLILLREGRVMYNGATTAAIPYLESIGYVCPPDTDFADFMVEFLVHPRFVYAQQQQLHSSLVNSASRTSLNTLAVPGSDFDKKSNSNLASLPSSGSSSGLRASASGIELSNLAITPARTTPPAGAVPSTIPSTTIDLECAFLQTPTSQNVLKELNPATANTTETGAAVAVVNSNLNGLKSILLNDYARALYGQPYVHSTWEHMKSGVARQHVINKRNTGFIIPRVIQAIFMSLVISSVFYDTAMDKVSNRVALMFFTITATAFGNMGELPMVVESKRVLYKQTESGMFPTAVYVISVILCHMPLLLLDAIIWSIVVYFMTSFTLAAGAYFVFIVVMIMHGLVMSIYVRLLTYVAPTEDMAVAVAGPSFMFMMSFGGYFITAESVPRWLLWAYHLSPFSWALRALAINEFTQSRYVHYADPVTGIESDVSKLFLGVYQFETEPYWIGAGVAALFAEVVLMAVLSIWVLSSVHYELSRGTKRYEESEHDDKPAAEPLLGGAAAPAAAGAASSATALPFKPVTLSFHNIHYTITDAAGHKRKLLADVSGYAKPYTLTALMGASGAGKTTLMDVVAGRKTQGKIEGDILLNGKKVSRSTFARIAGYVEQEDIHTPTATVRETLLFAANLRLPESVPSATKERVVDDMLDVLELTDVADRLIGNAGILGLSPGQLKRVTIGVELVANPTILFLDEPTTGLDSRSAYTVMRVIQKIAASGRSVVCTIHQPSAELFYMFDSLLVLAPGGIQTYFGAIGTRGRSLVHYFERLGALKRPRRQNPATWMISVISENSATATAAPLVVIEMKSSPNGETAIPTTAVVDVAPAPAAAAVKIDFGAAYAGSRLAVYCREQLSFLLTAAATNGAVEPKGVPVASGDDAVVAVGYAASLSSQFHYFLLRVFRSYWRNIPFIWTRAVIILLIAIMYGLIYLNVQTDTQGGVLSKAAAVILSAVIAGDLTSFTSLPVMMDQRSVFERERASRTYASIVHSISTFLVELPYTFVISLFFNLIFYWMVGFENSFEAFIKYTFVHYLVGLVYVTIGHTITAFSPSKPFAALIAGIYPPIFFLFSGMIIPGRDMPIGWQWLWHSTPLHHAFEALVMPQFVNANQIIDVVTGSGITQMSAASYASQYLQFPLPVNFWGPIGWLVLYMGCLRVATIYAMERISFVKR